MFIDEAKVYIKAGDGGKGCRSFYRDKYQRRGIPDGGNGGNGADIVVIADRNLITLLDFKYRRHFMGENGKHGSGKNKRGKNAEDLLIRVPCGTLIKDAKTGCCLADLTTDGQRVVLAKGGYGGYGNTHNHEVTEGKRGEDRELMLELKLIADIAIVGLPNAGKSTLICAISNSRSKIANYPFTTKSPSLGVVKGENFSFVAADIPGLIEGSHKGSGLGDRFLRHIERTKLILHLIDMSVADGRNAVEDYNILNKELSLFSKELKKKRQIIAANKMDLPIAKENLQEFKKHIKQRVYCISALEKEGLDKLIEAIRKRISAYSN